MAFLPLGYGGNLLIKCLFLLRTERESFEPRYCAFVKLVGLESLGFPTSDCSIGILRCEFKILAIFKPLKVVAKAVIVVCLKLQPS